MFEMVAGGLTLLAKLEASESSRDVEFVSETGNGADALVEDPVLEFGIKGCSGDWGSDGFAARVEIVSDGAGSTKKLNCFADAEICRAGAVALLSSGM